MNATGYGGINYEIQDREKNSFLHRCSVYIMQDMKVGDMLTEKNCVVSGRGWDCRQSIMKNCWEIK